MTIPPSRAAESADGTRTKKLAAVVFAALAALALVVLALTASGSGSEVIEVVVPLGTMERMDAGEQIELLPQRLELNVGDSLVIENNDEVMHQVGPYLVGPHQRIEQSFGQPGIIEGICTLHPSGQVSIVVS